ncbi:hypothetical protein NYA22BAC_02078 [Parasphingorhabdus sp. NYA22]
MRRVSPNDRDWGTKRTEDQTGTDVSAKNWSKFTNRLQLRANIARATGLPKSKHTFKMRLNLVQNAIALPTMSLFDLFKLLHEETILGVEIGLAVAIIFHLYS